MTRQMRWSAPPDAEKDAPSNFELALEPEPGVDIEVALLARNFGEWTTEQIAHE